MRQDNIAAKIWRIVYPLLFYYAVVLVTMTVAQWVIGTDKEHYVACQLIASAVAIPCMLPFYRQDQALRGIAEEKPGIKREQIVHGLWAAVIVILASASLNNLISMTPLVELSEGFREANAGFYGSTLVPELVGSAIVTPILEELVFRGIVFGRLSDMLSRTAAVLLSAFCFAIVHFNIVQFIYAFLVGIVLALLVECSGYLFAAVIGHIAANALAVVRTETGFLARTVDGSVWAWAVSAACLAAAVVLLYLYLHKLEKDAV